MYRKAYCDSDSDSLGTHWPAQSQILKHREKPIDPIDRSNRHNLAWKAADGILIDIKVHIWTQQYARYFLLSDAMATRVVGRVQFRRTDESFIVTVFGKMHVLFEFQRIPLKTDNFSIGQVRPRYFENWAYDTSLMQRWLPHLESSGADRRTATAFLSGVGDISSWSNLAWETALFSHDDTLLCNTKYLSSCDSLPATVLGGSFFCAAVLTVQSRRVNQLVHKVSKFYGSSAIAFLGAAFFRPCLRRSSWPSESISSILTRATRFAFITCIVGHGHGHGHGHCD